MTDAGKRDTPPQLPDPFALWRQSYEQAEQAWTKALQQTTGSDAFGESLGRSLDSYLGFQKMLRENMQVYLESMNVPTRNDIARLGELIVNLENKIDELDDRIDTLVTNVASLRRERAAGPSGAGQAGGARKSEANKAPTKGGTRRGREGS